MKALSIQQPWAWCILHAGKDVENRSWYTGFRGPFLIHAGKRFDLMAYEDLWEAGYIPEDMEPHDFPKGGIVGKAEITDCVTDWTTHWFSGPYGFVIGNPRAIPLVAYRGQLGFFDLDAEVWGASEAEYRRRCEHS